MRDSVPSARYSPICNVLRQWKTSVIPIYRVYRLYDKRKKQVLKSKVHLDYFNKLHDNFVLVPADKAIYNVTTPKKHFKNEQRKNILKMNKEVGMLLPKKELIQVE